MVWVRVAFHENDGNHENDENDEDNSDSCKQGVWVLDSRKSRKPRKWRKPRESRVQTTGSPNHRFRNGSDFLASKNQSLQAGGGYKNSMLNQES